MTQMMMMLTNYVPFPEQASEEQPDSNWKDDVEVVEVGVVRRSWRVAAFQVRPRTIRWQPERLVPEPRTKRVVRIYHDFDVHVDLLTPRPIHSHAVISYFIVLPSTLIVTSSVVTR